MKYIAQISYKHRIIDETILETDNKEEAIKAVKDMLHHLTDAEREDLAFLNVLESINPDTEAPDHFDGNIIFDAI